MGLCIALAQLAETLDPGTPASGLLPSNVKVPIDIATISVGGFHGSLHKFHISAPPGSILYVWSVLTSSSDSGTIGSPVADADAHHRGRWPYAHGIAYSPTITPTNNVEWHGFLIDCWPPTCIPVQQDAAPFICQPGDTFCVPEGNKGLYGVNMEYGVIINVTERHYVSAYLRARHTGDATFFQGAARDNDDNTYKRVPPLHYDDRDGVRLMNNHVIEGGIAFLFELATGGAATMPCELVIGISKTYPVPEPSG